MTWEEAMWLANDMAKRYQRRYSVHIIRAGKGVYVPTVWAISGEREKIK